MRVFLSLTALAVFAAPVVVAADPWVVYEGCDGPGKGKHIVLVSGDEEYRSEETLPQLAKILAKHHGFKCTVLFAIDPDDGTINPNRNDNIPGLEALKTADLMIIFTRFRNLPDEQMKHIVDYVESGKPIIGLRTATHAFDLKTSKTYAKYTWNGNGKATRRLRPAGARRDVGQSLGRARLAEHRRHHRQGSGDQPDPPRHQGRRHLGADGCLRGPSERRLHAAGARGRCCKGMKPTDEPVEGKKNDPMMPIAWTKMYKTESGKSARVFTTTMGAAQDFESEGLRRLLVNATYWALGMEDKIPDKSNVDIVGTFEAHPFKGNGFVKGVKPSDLAIK